MHRWARGLLERVTRWGYCVRARFSFYRHLLLRFKNLSFRRPTRRGSGDAEVQSQRSSLPAKFIMSELTSVADGGEIVVTETLVEVEKRHKAEIRKLEGEVRALLKTAKKSTKAQIETQIIRMQYELKERQQEEYDAAEAAATNATGSVDADAPAPADENSAEEADHKTEEEIAAAKKAKSKKKQDKKKTKEQEKHLEKLSIQAENSGPSAREIEVDKINSKLLPDSLQVKAILSDGNCLYRAISDQLALVKADKVQGFGELRGIAAAYMKSHPEDFCPFLGLDASDPEFEQYCDKVASTTQAEWGGQPEIRALAAALQRPIHIYSADAPVVCMEGEEVRNPSPLRITYHKHYYALGEHYNSVAPTADSALAGLSI